MRWPRRSRRPEEGTTQSRNSSSSSSESAHGDKVTSPSEEDHDPVLARLFSDAASFNRILNTGPEVVSENAEDSRQVHDSLNGFSQLVGCDLDDNERVASEKLAQLTVSNWGPEGTTTLAPDVDDETDDGASDDEQDKAPPSGTVQAGKEPAFDDKVASNEVLELLQNEFGALAPPGEEKLLVEADATVFQDVVILVWSFARDDRRYVVLTSDTGRGTSHHTSPHVPCIALVVSSRPERKNLEVWFGVHTPQEATPQEESLAPVDPRHDQHVQFERR